MGNLLSALNQVIATFVNVLKEILCGGLEQKDLIIVVTVMRQIATLLADELIVQTAVGDVASSVIRAQSQLLWSGILLVRLLVFVMIGATPVVYVVHTTTHIVVDLAAAADHVMRMHLLM